jgi:NitT/TauT family transport system ATP-binding protein
MRRWLMQGGIDPDRDVRLMVLPPTQMAGALKAGLIDGYCVGEPWNSVAVADGTGWCPAISEDLAPGHPEKILLSTEAFAATRSDALHAVIRALHEACAFCDDPKNRSTVIDILIASGHMQADREILKRSLIGPFDNGAGERRSSDRFHIFHRDKANVPSLDKAEWVVNSLHEHGLIARAGATAARQAISQCWRPDIFHQAFNPARGGARRRTSRNHQPKLALV